MYITQQMLWGINEIVDCCSSDVYLREREKDSGAPEGS
jgi:hypothetical protein